MATTFYWGGTSTTHDITDVATTGTRIVVSNVYRPLRQSVTRHKVEIPGKTGSWDFGGGVRRDYSISVDLIIVASKSSDVTACATALETALEGKENLIFSDSTSMVHTGQIFSEITMTPEGSGNIARATLEFECDGETGGRWTFDETLSDALAEVFGYVRQSVAYDSDATEVAANTPVYETI